MIHYFQNGPLLRGGLPSDLLLRQFRQQAIENSNVFRKLIDDEFVIHSTKCSDRLVAQKACRQIHSAASLTVSGGGLVVKLLILLSLIELLWEFICNAGYKALLGCLSNFFFAFCSCFLFFCFWLLFLSFLPPLSPILPILSGYQSPLIARSDYKFWFLLLSNWRPSFW